MKHIFTESKHLTKLYNQYNNTFFEGKLKVDNIGFSKRSSKHVLGLTYFDRDKRSNIETVTIVINPLIKVSTKTVQNTLIHEMIHVWQKQIEHTSPGHNRQFDTKAKSFDKHGFLVRSFATEKILPKKVINLLINN